MQWMQPYCSGRTHNVVDVAINTQLTSFQNCLNFLLQLCQEKVEKTFPYIKCLHGQCNTVLQATDCPQASVQMGMAYLTVLILKIPKYTKKPQTSLSITVTNSQFIITLLHSAQATTWTTKNSDSIFGRGRCVFTSTNHPDWLCGSFSLLYDRKRANVTRALPRLRMHRTIPHLPLDAFMAWCFIQNTDNKTIYSCYVCCIFDTASFK